MVRIGLKRPYAMNVWGPFACSAARAVTVSVEDADDFILARERQLADASAADGASESAGDA